MPPLHHEVVTATLRTGTSAAALQEAQAELEAALRALDERYEATPAGLGRHGGVGPSVLPPLRGGAGRKASAGRHARDGGGRQARAGARERGALPQRPARDDPRGERRGRPSAQRLARHDRRRLAGAVRGARRDVPRHEHPARLRRRRLRRLAQPAEEHGDGRRRPRAPISFPTRRSSSSGSRRRRRPASGPSRIANFETLGYVDLRDSRYFAHGTHMHVSHLFENLEAWYLNFDHRERVDTTFRPGLDVPVEKLTVPQGPDDVQTDAGRLGGLRGHAADRAQRLDPAVVAAGRGR